MTSSPAITPPLFNYGPLGGALFVLQIGPCLQNESSRDMVHPEQVIRFRDTFSQTHLFYKLIGLRPFSHENHSSWLWDVVFWLSFVNLTASYIAEWIYLCLALGHFDSMLSIIELLPCMCFVTLSINAMAVSRFKREELVRVIDILEEQFPKGLEEQRAQKIPDKKRLFDRLLRGFAVAFLALIVTFNFIEFGGTVVHYLNSGAWEMSLPYFLWYPFDAYDRRYFPYVYLHQTWAGFTCVFAIMAETFLIATSALQFCIQFESISNSIRGYHPHKGKDEAFVRRITLQHNSTLSNTKGFQDIISVCIFIHHTCSSLIICCAVFHVVVGDNLTAMFKFMQFLFCSLMQTIVLSYFGNEISECVRPGLG